MILVKVWMEGVPATYRTRHQHRDPSTLHRAHDGGDEDQDGANGVVEELLRNQRQGPSHTAAGGGRQHG